MIRKILIQTFVTILCIPVVATAGLADTIFIASRTSSISAKAVVVLPKSYPESDTKYGVVYLLHGWSGNYRNWFDKADLQNLADGHNVLIVCPDGGYAGWYLDSPVNENSRYATYIGQEVVNYIDQNYRTLPTVNGRALCGLSMGGYGALFLLIKYPHIFSMAGSISGLMEFTPNAQRYGIDEILGTYDSYAWRWADYSCVSLADSLVSKNKSIMIDCGISDPFIESNRKLHRLLIDSEVAHDYIERPGGHTWNYWTNALDYHFLFFMKNGLAKP